MEKYVSEESLERACEILNRWPHRPDPDTPTIPAPSKYADRGGATLEEVAKELGVTKERVRQIEAQALRKLRSLPLSALLR